MKFFLFLLLMVPNLLYSNNISVCLSLVKQNYQADEPIHIELSLKNIGTDAVSFILSDIIAQSVHFELRTSKNEAINFNHTTTAGLTGLYANPALYRTVNLMPGESFSRLFDLRELYDITSYDMFYVRAVFYMDPDNINTGIPSEYTVFSHNPPSLVLRKMVQDDSKRSQEKQQLAVLLPNELVDSFFQAQFTKDWEKFLLHIDTERLLQSFQNYSIPYNKSTDADFKLELLSDFQRFITVHWNIPLVRYEINESTIRGDTAYVTVSAVESIRATSRRVRYTFTLYRTSGGSWLIADYRVLALN